MLTEDLSVILLRSELLQRQQRSERRLQAPRRPRRRRRLTPSLWRLQVQGAVSLPESGPVCRGCLVSVPVTGPVITEERLNAPPPAGASDIRAGGGAPV